MKYPYSVKYNGIWYAAGEEIPAAEPTKEVVKEPVNPIREEVKAEKTVTKTDLIRMNAAALKKLATENGIKDVDDKTRSELIQAITDKLGL